MAGDNTLRQEMWQLYLSGKTAIDAEQATKYNYSTIKKYYTDFMIESAYAKANDRAAEIRQIMAIERELFECYDLFKVKKTDDALNKTIAELELVYVKFQALS